MYVGGLSMRQVAAQIYEQTTYKSVASCASLRAYRAPSIRDCLPRHKRGSSPLHRHSRSYS